LDLAIHYDDTAPVELLDTPIKYNFPDFQPYEFETEQVYQFTNFDKNSRKVVNDRLTLIRESVKIDDMDTPSTETYKRILELSE
jgi:plasmid maintenance system killer protein